MTALHCKIEAGTFGAFEAACSELVLALREGQNLVEHARRLGTTAEYALCGAFRSTAETAYYWVDGVELAEVELASGTCVQAHGFAWCADDRNQWKVATLMLIDYVEGPPFAVPSVKVHLGDADYADLRSQPAWTSKSRIPSKWLYTFTLESRVVAGMLPDEIARLENRLRDWVTLTPTRAIVGADWRRLTLEQSLQCVRQQSGSGHLITVEETWLDGEPAMSIKLSRWRS